MPSNEVLLQYLRFSLEAGWSSVNARVVGESSIGLSVNGTAWLNFLCTPTAVEELALGFLFNEGIIDSIDEVADTQVCSDGTHVDVWLTHTATRPEKWTRTSGCGGGSTQAEARIAPGAAWEKMTMIQPEQLVTCMNLLQEAQNLYRETGGIHCSALSDGEKIRCRAEDIGRHNTFDKLAGQALRKPGSHYGHILLTTGRISSEMIQKATRMGVEVVVSRTSPTSESIRIAEQAGITLCGYARREQIYVYTHSERLGYPPDSSAF